MPMKLDIDLKGMESKFAPVHRPPTKLFSWPCSLQKLCCDCHLPPKTTDCLSHPWVILGFGHDLYYVPHHWRNRNSPWTHVHPNLDSLSLASKLPRGAQLHNP